MSSRALKGKVDLDTTRGALEQLGLSYMAESLQEHLNAAVKGGLPAHKFLDTLLAVETTTGRRRALPGGRAGGGRHRGPCRGPQESGVPCGVGPECSYGVRACGDPHSPGGFLL
jgi:hypothetical protein